MNIKVSLCADKRELTESLNVLLEGVSLTLDATDMSLLHSCIAGCLEAIQFHDEWCALCKPSFLVNKIWFEEPDKPKNPTGWNNNPAAA
jgi:hypothetical protein